MHRAHVIAACLALSLGFIFATLDWATACGTGKLILEDKFATLDPAWGFAEKNDERSNGPDGLTYKLPPGENVDLLNQSGLNDNYEVCATFTSEGLNDSGDYVGVNFWSVDQDNDYEADIFPAEGTFAVYRYQNKRSLNPVAVTDSAAINKGPNATNEVSVAVNGRTATFSVNGKTVSQFNGFPPDGGSLFGFNIGISKKAKEPGTVVLKSIQLRELPASG